MITLRQCIKQIKWIEIDLECMSVQLERLKKPNESACLMELCNQVLVIRLMLKKKGGNKSKQSEKRQSKGGNNE